MLRLLLRAAALVAVTTLPFAAVAQNVGGTPLYGTVTLRAGFEPDPHNVNLTAGGNDLSTQGGCNAYVAADQPDVKLVYTAGSTNLYIGADSETDTVLLVNLPNGSWVCDDDGGDGANPLLAFEDPQSGTYDIWVGTYAADAQGPATLQISEVRSRITSEDASSSSSSTDSTTPDFSAEALYGSVDLSAGFDPDPYTVTITAGGNDAINVSTCSGYIAASQPDFELRYTAGQILPLHLYVASETDTVLLVNTPNGDWICDDDSGEGTNPALTFEQPSTGTYDIWIGTYAPDAQTSSTLYISEIGQKKK